MVKYFWYCCLYRLDVVLEVLDILLDLVHFYWTLLPIYTSNIILTIYCFFKLFFNNVIFLFFNFTILHFSPCQLINDIWNHAKKYLFNLIISDFYFNKQVWILLFFTFFLAFIFVLCYMFWLDAFPNYYYFGKNLIPLFYSILLTFL